TGGDPLYEQARSLVILDRTCSIDLLQRTFLIGYARASRIIEELEEKKVVAPWDGETLERRVLQTDEDLGEEHNADVTDVDERYEQARTLVLSTGFASPALFQRRLRMSYPRAARLMQLLEANGVIGPADGAKPRPVLLSWEDLLSNE